ncbi:MAG: FecR domain-containing protein, partial [Bdellovibrionota bacterium]
MNFKQWNRIDRSIFTAAAVLLLLFSYFLYDDSFLFSGGAESNQEQVGTIKTLRNDVRRKNQETFSWSPALAEQNVRHLDTIFTGDNSEANIQLNDGSVIKLKPNTLVTINMRDGQMSLDLKYGDLVGEFSKDSQLNLMVNGESQTINGANQSSIQIKKNKGGDLDLQLLNGQASLGNQAIKNAVPPKITNSDLNIEKFTPDEAFEIPFTSLGDQANFEVVVAQDSTFQTVVLRKKTERMAVMAPSGFPDGSYSWKVTSLRPDGTVWVETPARKLNVSVTATPQWISPKANDKITKRIKSGATILSASVDLSWSPSRAALEYEVEIAADPQFMNVTSKFKSSLPEVTSPLLVSGQYYLRVRGMKGELSTPWSQTHAMTLDVLMNNLDAPKLARRNIDFTPPLPAERRPASEMTPQMEWSNVNGADNYVLQLSKTPEFADGFEKQLTNTTFNWEKYKAGRYYFRVIAQGNDGSKSPPSQTGVVTIDPGSPIIDKINPLVFSKMAPGQVPPPQSVDVKWTNVASATNYELEIDKDPNFKSPTKVITRSPSSVVTVNAPGEYHVRVRGVDQTGRTLTKYSPVEDIIYKFKNQLSSPAIVGPFNELTLFLQNLATPFLRFEWKPVPLATRYDFEISHVSDFTQI